LILVIVTRYLLGKHIRDNTSYMISFFFPYLLIPQHRWHDKARSKLGEIIHEVVRSRRSSGLTENDRPFDRE
jgi:hypothetical protein